MDALYKHNAEKEDLHTALACFSGKWAVWQVTVYVLILPLRCCVTLEKLPHLSGAQMPHL